MLAPLDENADDPLDVIGRSYFFSSSCARMIGDFPKRWDELNELYGKVRGDGVIFERIIFCDPWGADLHNIMHRIEKENTFPLLSLTREYNIVPTGQLKTRVQAFLEKLEIAKAQKAQKVAAGGER